MQRHAELARRYAEDLSSVEFENQRILDDDSCRLLAEVMADGLLTAIEWHQIKTLLKDALLHLSKEQQTIVPTADGKLLLDPDADPRNADWLRCDAAMRLSGRVLPVWATLWLWRLRTDTSRTFWSRVGWIADQLGYPEYPPQS